jgi:hypothetical protein
MRLVLLHLYMCAAAAVLISACATGPAIHHESNPAATFSDYKSTPTICSAVSPRAARP